MSWENPVQYHLTSCEVDSLKQDFNQAFSVAKYRIKLKRAGTFVPVSRACFSLNKEAALKKSA